MGMTKKKTIEEKRAYLKEVHEDCGERWAFLQQGLPPGTALNTMEMRVNTLIIFLVEWGLISEDQKVDFEIKFAENIQDHLIAMKKDYDEQMEAARKPKLVIPNAAEAAQLKNIGKV